jgi:hypothetical protein
VKSTFLSSLDDVVLLFVSSYQWFLRTHIGSSVNVKVWDATGMQRSKLTAYFHKCGAVASTLNNWRAYLPVHARSPIRLNFAKGHRITALITSVGFAVAFS